MFVGLKGALLQRSFLGLCNSLIFNALSLFVNLWIIGLAEQSLPFTLILPKFKYFAEFSLLKDIKIHCIKPKLSTKFRTFVYKFINKVWKKSISTLKFSINCTQ